MAIAEQPASTTNQQQPLYITDQMTPTRTTATANRRSSDSTADLRILFGHGMVNSGEQPLLTSTKHG